MLAINSFKSKFIPAVRSSPANPLLVLVHGRTGNIRVLEWFSKRFQIEELSYLAVEAPYPDQNPNSSVPGFSWYLKDKKGIEESRSGFMKLVEELTSQNFTPENIYWLGFSQGAAMSLDLALRAQLQLGGFICVAGFCVQSEAYPKAFGPFAKKQKILITHGTRDETILLEDAEKSYDVLRKEGVPFELKVYDKPHSFQLKEEVPFLEETLKSWIRTK